GNRARLRPSRLHEQQRHWSAGDVADPREPPRPEAAGRGAQRALSPHLRADAPRRGHPHLRHRVRGAQRSYVGRPRSPQRRKGRKGGRVRKASNVRMPGGVPAPNASNFPCDGHYVLRFTFCEEVKMEGTPEKVERARSDLEYWAAPVERLKVT